MRRFDPLAPDDAAFCLAMNRANCLAYDGAEPDRPTSELLGMPRWVFLDCCALPSVVFGMFLPRAHVPSTYAALIDPDGLCDVLPVAEYIALPSLIAGEFVGVSLFSFLAEGSWGRRVKAMALYALGARTQVGVAQYSNPSIRLHLAFGPLHLLQASVDVHSRPGETFVYRVTLPPDDELLALGRGDKHTLNRRTAGVDDVRLAPDDVAGQAARLSGRYSIVDALVGGSGDVVEVVFGEV